MPNLKAEVWDTVTLIKSPKKRELFNQKWSREVGVEANIDNQSKSLSHTFIAKLHSHNQSLIFASKRSSLSSEWNTVQGY